MKLPPLTTTQIFGPIALGLAVAFHQQLAVVLGLLVVGWILYALFKPAWDATPLAKAQAVRRLERQRAAYALWLELHPKEAARRAEAIRRWNEIREREGLGPPLTPPLGRSASVQIRGGGER